MSVLTADELESRAAPGTYPIPAGRGRWRFTLHKRVFSTAATYPNATSIGELTDARSRNLQQAWNQPAVLTFVVDGHSPSAAEVAELQTDVIAWRWSTSLGIDVPLFRGIVAQSQDDITEQSHTVTFTCHDYFAMLSRRTITDDTPLTYTQQDQDLIVQNLLHLALNATTSAGVSFSPGSQLPLSTIISNPDGSGRAALSGQLRDRSYLGNTIIGNEIDNLAKVINGFDYDVLARSDANGIDYLRLFYPQQGVTRNDMTFTYGANVATVSRSINSADYSNYIRVLGNNGSSDPNAAQMFSEDWNADSNNVGQVPVGLWMTGAAASDVNIQATLDEKATGDLSMDGILQPVYTLGLRPGFYNIGYPNMGDTVQLQVNSGRLNVNTPVRVLGITYGIGDDGEENVSLTVARPVITLSAILAEQQRQVAALTRR